MKQKNLILVAVAVGCGLVAAFLTSQMSGRTAKSQTTKIPVAKKEIPVGWKISKNEVNEYVEYKEFTTDSAPVAYVDKPEDLADKRVRRVIRVGESFNPADLTDSAPLPAPEGKNVITVPMSIDKAVAGFAGPGSKVDILATLRVSKRNKFSETFYILTDMLVLAVDGNNAYPDKGQVFMNLSTVSLAVDAEQARLIQAAQGRGADFRLVLQNSEKPAKIENAPDMATVWRIVDDEPLKGGDGNSTSPGPRGSDEVVIAAKNQYPVLTENAAKGTLLTKDMLKWQEFTPPAPANALLKMEELVGKWLTADLQANQFIPKGCVADSDPFRRVEPTVPGAREKDPPLEDIGPTKKPVYWEVTIQTASGVKKYRYQMIEDGDRKGEWTLLGEVRDDGSVVAPKGGYGQSTPPPAPPKPESKDEEKKDEKKPTGERKISLTK